MKLTKAQKVMLQIANALGGTMRIFPDQWSTASVLEARGLLAGNGKHFDRASTLTDLGRRALEQSQSQESTSSPSRG